MIIAPRFAIVLAAALLWTTLFSMTNQFPMRGLRNLGIVACYIVGFIMFFLAGFKNAFATWVLFGFIGGALYFTYDLIVRAKTKEGEKKPKISLSHFVFAVVAFRLIDGCSNPRG